MYGWVEALHIIRVYKSCTDAEQRKQVRDWYWGIKDNFDREKRIQILESLT